ncbi:MAG: hypothetical protein OXC44_01670 [Proteobacteria bacterium]|nr:hypothetical protein [Pseudomonadota bacterium]
MMVLALALPYEYGYGSGASAVIHPFKSHLSNVFSLLVKRIPKHYSALFGGSLMLSVYASYKYKSHKPLQMHVSASSLGTVEPLSLSSSANSSSSLGNEDYLLEGQQSFHKNQEPPEPGGSLGLPLKENDELSSGSKISVRSAWQRFQDDNLAEYYYDNVSGITPHHELPSLINQYFILDDQKIFLILSKFITDNQEPFFHVSELQRWEKKLMDRFIHQQLTSFRELHVFLRKLLPQHISTPLSKVVSYYDFSIAEWHAKEAYILSLLKDFHQDSPRRFGPLKQNIVTINDAVKAIRFLNVMELQARIAAIKIESTPLSKSIDTSWIRAVDVVEFLDSLDNKTHQKIFINDILLLSKKNDITQKLSHKQFFHQLVVSHQLRDFLIKKQSQKRLKEVSGSSTTTEARLRFLNRQLLALTDKQLLSLLLNITLKGKPLFSFSHSRSVSKKHIVDFFHSLETTMEKDIFFHLVLKRTVGLDVDIGERYELDIHETAKFKAKIINRLIDSLQPVLKGVASTMEGSFEHLQDIYEGLKSEEVIEKLKESPLLASENISHMSYANSYYLHHFIKRFLKKPVDWHVFYVYFLGLDKPHMEYLSVLHQVSLSAIKYRKNLFQTHLVRMFRNGHLDGTPYHTSAYLEGVHSFDELTKTYYKLIKLGKGDFLQKQLYSTLRNSKEYKDEKLEDITSKKVQFYLNKVLTTDKKKHIFFSFFLKLDEAQVADLTKMYKNTDSIESNIYKHRKIMNRQLLDLADRNTKYDHALMMPKETVSNPLDLDKLKEIYMAIPKTSVVNRMIANVSGLKSSGYYSSEEIKDFKRMMRRLTIDDVHEFVHFHLKDHIIRWNLFLGDMLGAIHLNKEHLSKIAYYPSLNAMGGERKKMVDILYGIITKDKGSHHPKIRPLHYETFTIEQLRDIYAGMSFEEKSSRILQALLEGKPRTLIYPQITDDHINYIVKRYLNTSLTERIFYSEFLRLDYTHYPDSWPEIYQKQSETSVQRKKYYIKEKVHDSLIRPRVRKQTSMDVEASSMLKQLSEKYLKLGSKDILERIRKSYVFHGYEEAASYLNMDIVNEFIEKTLNNRSSLEKSQFMWHIFLCETLQLCKKTSRQTYIKWYKPANKDIISTHRYAIKRTIIYLIYRDSKDYQDFINNDSESINKKQTILNMAKNHPYLLKKDPQNSARFGFSYLQSSLIENAVLRASSLEVMHQRFVSLTDAEKQLLLKEAGIIADKTYDISLGHHLDAYIANWLGEDIYLHIFYALVLKVDTSLSQDISALYKSHNNAEVMDIADGLRGHLIEYFSSFNNTSSL